MNDPIAFQSSSLLEADFAAARLQDAGIPFFRSMESAGIRQGMPASPVDFPGIIWSLHVPAAAMVDAQRVLQAMPPLRTTGGRSPRTRVELYVAVVFGLFLVLLIGTCAAELFR